MRHAHRRQARIERIAKQDPAIRPDAHLVDIDVAREMAIALDIEPAEEIVVEFVGVQNILQPPNLGRRADIDPLRRSDEAYKLTRSSACIAVSNAMADPC
jgi:hypothetical protein